ncbi:MAG: triose-phosphate isomerase [Alphaproteobacteria bacterium]
MSTNAPIALVAGNWKMNGLASALAEAEKIAAGAGSGQKPACKVMLCPPVTLLASMRARLGSSPVLLGGQDCHANASGAHTGDISAEMIRDAGGVAVIVGHSERRADHGESNALVQAKALAAHRAGLIAIVCVGETELERNAGKALEVVGAQLAGSLPGGGTANNLVVAYEPVWAIGTGKTPTAADVAEVHFFIRTRLQARFPDGAAFRILYGGSVKPGNAVELMGVAHVNGALVGGASLKAEDFLGIIAAYR